MKNFKQIQKLRILRGTDFSADVQCYES